MMWKSCTPYEVCAWWQLVDRLVVALGEERGGHWKLHAKSYHISKFWKALQGNGFYVLLDASWQKRE